MLNLDGYLDVEKIYQISKYVKLRFRNAMLLQTPEAFAAYENKFLPEEQLKKLCEEHYGVKLEEPLISYIPDPIKKMFAGSDSVPVLYRPTTQELTLVKLPEIEPKQVVQTQYKLTYIDTTIYYYLKAYQRFYGSSPLLYEVPVKMMFDLLVTEAIDLGAADMTISTVGRSTQTYYNVRKKRVDSNKVFDRHFMDDLLVYLTTKSPKIIGDMKPKYVDVELNKDFRGRVLINTKFDGVTITIRLLPNAAFDADIHNLGFNQDTAEWLRNNILDNKPGLRLIVGATMSGKNTTALSLLREIAECHRYKIVSVEIPVEQELPGIEQINNETPEDYADNIKSLIHQNPDFVYITEIRDSTGLPTLQITNTGKCVLSTLHSNGVADTISRLCDVTGLGQDRIIQALHTVVYQELVRDEEADKVFPRCRYIHFDNELKYKLYGKSLGEVIKIINDNEGGDRWTSTALTLL